MKKKFLTFALLAVIAFVYLPAESRAAGPSSIGMRETAVAEQPGRRTRRGRKFRNTHGYRNYGQYRRTQVGNRRYRLVRQYYWRDGVRIPRLVRVYY